MSSTIHRFTPPTCTLEITGKKLPLSRWLSSDVLKKFQFHLRFDDPRQTTFKQITIQGDRQDLLKLQTAINHYVQMQLKSSFQAKNIQIAPKSAATRENMPYLTPQGLMYHELFFGSLTHDSDRHSIRLGTVQLFDLVTALEAYQTKMLALSDSKQSRSLAKVIPFWGKIAAVAFTAIGIITVLKPQIQPEVVTNSSQPQSSSKIPELNEITPPSTPDPSQKTATPKLRDPLASTTRLPPPPAVETPKPKPNIPDPADYELSDVARQSGLDNSVKNKASNNRESKSVTISPETAKPEIIAQNRIHAKTDLEPNSDTLDESLVKPSKPSQDLAVQSSSNRSNQVQQITAYFENKWQPPAELNQSLEYRLFLNRNGSVTRIIPLGKAAQFYLSQTNIPVNGEAFISPMGKSQPSVIRLLLNPNGKVQVFTESR
jgi:hypothetical protein